jgi:hypothetical protein
MNTTFLLAEMSVYFAQNRPTEKAEHWPAIQEHMSQGNIIYVLIKFMYHP